MTDKELIEIEIAYFQEQIKVKQKKLKELEQTKSPVKEAYKDWWGDYPELETDSQYDDTRWAGFQAGYEFAYKEKVSEEPEEQKWDAVRESVKWCEENPDKDPLDWLKPQNPEKLTKDKVSLYKRFYKKGWTISADDFCEIVRKFLMDEAVLEKEDYEYITFTLQKSLLEVPND